MSEHSSVRSGEARAAASEDLQAFVHEGNEEILLALLENPAIEERHLIMILERLDIPVSVPTAIAAKAKWVASEAVRLHLATNPKTPRRTALTLVRQLYLFDLVRLSLLPSTPAEIKRLAEEVIITRVPQIPIGEKLTLARRGPSRVAGAILAEGHVQAVKLALANAFLSESQVLKVIANSATAERVISEIAQHPKWSIQYNVRVGLLRNAHTPPPSVLAFLPNITLRDLKDVARLESIPAHVKRYIQNELARRQGSAAKESR
jgi:hypothetical protein